MTKPKAYLNALAEEGTRQDLIDWLVKLDAENDALRGASHKTIETPDLRMVLEACRGIGMDGIDLED